MQHPQPDSLASNPTDQVYHLHSVLSAAPMEALNTLIFTPEPSRAPEKDDASANPDVLQTYRIEIDHPFLATRDMLESLREMDADRPPGARPEHYLGALLAYAVQNGHDGLLIPQGFSAQSGPIAVPAYPGQIYPVAPEPITLAPESGSAAVCGPGRRRPG